MFELLGITKCHLSLVYLPLPRLVYKLFVGESNVISYISNFQKKIVVVINCLYHVCNVLPFNIFLSIFLVTTWPTRSFHVNSS